MKTMRQGEPGYAGWMILLANPWERARPARRLHCKRRFLLFLLTLCLCASVAYCLGQEQSPNVYLIKPSRIFAGESPIEGMVVLARGEKIEAVGAIGKVKAPAQAKTIDLPNTTLLPGLIEARSHVLQLCVKFLIQL